MYPEQFQRRHRLSERIQNCRLHKHYVRILVQYEYRCDVIYTIINCNVQKSRSILAWCSKNTEL